MKYGVFIVQTDVTITPAEPGREAEDRGFESLFFAEHTHIPVDRRSPFPAGGELPDPYRRILDPLVALASVAGATTDLRLGTGVCLVAQHDPITLAKQVATLDQLSGGRVVLGVGYGWNREEAADHGLDPAHRRAILREKVLAMQRLWTEDEATFDGEHVRFSPSWCWPKPRQQPHPPVLIGGAAGPKLFRHIAEFADGWMPIGGSGLAANLVELHRVAQELGRDPESLAITVFGTHPDAAKIEHYASLGVERVVFTLPSSADPAKVLRALDRAAAVLPR